MEMTDFGIPGFIFTFIVLVTTLLPLILLVLFFVYLGGIRNALRDIRHELEQLNKHLRSQADPAQRSLSRSERIDR